MCPHALDESVNLSSRYGRNVCLLFAVCFLFFVFCFLLFVILLFVAYSFQHSKLIVLSRMPDVTDVAHMTSLLTRVGESTALEHLSISNISKD